MPKIGRVSKENYWAFMCPGCNETHTINADKWLFNNDVLKPTIMPSILCRSGHYAPNFEKGDACWCTHNELHPERKSFECNHCHSYVRDGMIQFLNDCSHELKGQTVELPDWQDN